MFKKKLDKLINSLVYYFKHIVYLWKRKREYNSFLESAQYCLYDTIRYATWGKDYDINEDFYCMCCGKPVFHRILYCSEKCCVVGNKMMARDTSLIPNGLYCYDLLDVIKSKKFGFQMKVRVCPYWSKFSTGEGHCQYLEEADLTLLGDQCKICGINDDIEE